MKKELKNKIIAKEKEIEMLINHDSWLTAEKVNEQRIHLIKQYESFLSTEEKAEQDEKNVKAFLQNLKLQNILNYIF